jgi:2-amino-4-hydroxy-6-hydroxymethyldihydropteridine diphosphokinase
MTSTLRFTTAYLGLGSNLGNKKQNISKALELLRGQREIKVVKTSSFYLTSPVGPKQPDFINAVSKIRTTLDPKALLKKAKEIEKELGRTKTIRRGPRVVDIDILFYGSKIMRSRTLTIPHPLLTSRRFVLEPLSEIVPGFVHPVLKKTVKKLKENALTFVGQKVKIT